jgi:uncharacterized protein YjlB
MAGLEDAQRAVEEIAGQMLPHPDKAAALTQPARPEALLFSDDGLVPNHPSWPLLLYREAVRFPSAFDPAAVLEDLFRKNGWGGIWRDGIYGYTHYHSQIHEVLGVARGSAKVQFGGENGTIVEVRAGDVAILPAGTGHKLIEASKDFLVIGAYPPDGKYDERTSAADHEQALETVPNTPRPASDPVYGADGPLLGLWT